MTSSPLHDLAQPPKRSPLLLPGLLGLIALLVLVRLGPDLWHSLFAPTANLQRLAQIELGLLGWPRVLSGLLAGAALGLAGALFQAITRNPLASPDLLGVTGGCQLGLIACLLLGLGPGWMPLALLLTGLLGAGLTLATAGGFRSPALRLILAGSACALLASAITTLCLALFEQKLEGVALWSLGVLYQPGSQGLWLMLPWIGAALLALVGLGRPLQILQLGDEPAQLLGLNLGGLRARVLLGATLLTAVAVTLAGPIGFIGLLAPNLIRAQGLHLLRQQLPLSALVGAALLLASDSLVVLLQLDTLLSAGIMLALLGTPALLALVFYQRQLLSHGHSDSLGGTRRPYPGLRLVALSLLLVLALGLSILSGSHPLSIADLWAAIQGEHRLAALLIDLRLPRALVAGIGGALLAASGLLLQSLTRNPLAGPDLLGLTQASAFCALLTLCLWPQAPQSLLFMASLAGGGLLLALILTLTRRHHFAPLPVALTGLVLGALCMALSGWLIAEFSVQPAQSLVWLVGSTYGRSWSQVWALAPWLLLSWPLWRLARPLDLLQLGTQNAQALGLPLSQIRLKVLVLATLLTAATVAVIGPIAFIGLMTPHLVQRLGFQAHRLRLPAAMLAGALLLVLADWLGRTLLAPTEIPAGVLTAFLGAPYLLWRLGRANRR